MKDNSLKLEGESSHLQKKCTIKANLTEKEAADYLAVSAYTLRNWRFQRKGPAYRKFGRSVRYALDDLQEFSKTATRIMEDRADQSSGAGSRSNEYLARR